MDAQRILIVDDEKNIRLTLAQALESTDLDAETAVNGHEALDRLAQRDIWLVLLDLKMPGLDGMEVLRRLRENHPEVRVVIITAHGTVENAVEAMKLGAVDFLQKPFAPDEVRDLVARIRQRETLAPEHADDYTSLIELARRSITQRQFDDAAAFVHQALKLDATHPEAYNLLGVLDEIRGDRFEAQQHYRKALDLDPTYAPARANLRQSVEPGQEGSFILDEVKKEATRDADDARIG